MSQIFSGRPLCAETLALLRLHLEPAIEPAVARQVFDAFERPSEIFASRPDVLSQWMSKAVAQRLCQPVNAALARAIRATLQWASRPGCVLLTWLDRAYPAVLRELSDAPVVLYAQGELGVLSQPAVTIVGARDATAAGERLAFQLARQLALANWTVVSGLAVGIDASAHRGALAAAAQIGCAQTVAVMATPPDRIYPARHRALAAGIVQKGGLLLTEFALGTSTMAHHFPQRNRLVAALGRATVVVQARARSGSLITARLANELGRDVFAMPGPANHPLSAGCHELIRQGAGLLEGVDDLWQAFGLSALSKQC